MSLEFVKKIIVVFFIFIFIFSPRCFAVSLPTEKQFTGHVFDQSSDLYYMRARYYDPVIGRFLSPDHGGDSLNRYFYVNNNPLAFIDPMGKQGKWVHEGLKNEEPLIPYFIYEQWVKSDFPLALNPAYPLSVDLSIVNPTNWGDVRLLDRKALQHLTENPFDPATQTEDFIEYLAQDISESYPYNEGLRQAWNYEDIFKAWGPHGIYSSLRKNENNELTYLNLEYSMLRYKMAQNLKDKEWEEYDSASFSERLERGLFVCYDFALWTEFVAGRGGVYTEHFSLTTINHSVGVLPGEEPKVFDTTNWAFWESLVPFEEYRANNPYGWVGYWETSAIWQQ